MNKRQRMKKMRKIFDKLKNFMGDYIGMGNIILFLYLVALFILVFFTDFDETKSIKIMPHNFWLR